MVFLVLQELRFHVFGKRRLLNTKTSREVVPPKSELKECTSIRKPGEPEKFVSRQFQCEKQDGNSSIVERFIKRGVILRQTSPDLNDQV